MTARLVASGLLAALAAINALPASAQSGAQGYVTDTRGAVVKDPYNLCWRTGYWTPALATLECDPDLVPKPRAAEPPPPPAAPPPKPAAVPPPAPKSLLVRSSEYFDFDKAVLRPEAMTTIDKEVIAKLGGFSSIKLIMVSGHTDRIGTQQFNQKLSERRADAVKAYLVSKGVDGSKIETIGFGKTNPQVSCPDPAANGPIKTFKELIACLKPNRRVEIEVTGMPK